VHDLVRQSGNISIHVIAGDEFNGEPVPKKAVHTIKGAEPFNPRPYIAALIAVI
jgi:two-component system sensor histidine kinase KdpD